MQTVQITSGQFTANNNFSGYNAKGERIHIPARQLEILGINKETKIQFPIFCLVVEKEFAQLDADRNPTGGTFKRLQAGSTFLTKAEMIAAVNGDRMLALEVEADFKAQATSAGLTTEDLAVLNAAI